MDANTPAATAPRDTNPTASSPLGPRRFCEAYLLVRRPEAMIFDGFVMMLLEMVIRVLLLPAFYRNSARDLSDVSYVGQLLLFQTWAWLLYHPLFYAGIICCAVGLGRLIADRIASRPPNAG